MKKKFGPLTYGKYEPDPEKQKIWRIWDAAGKLFAETLEKEHAALIAAAPEMMGMLNDNLSAWEGEEESVRSEHRELIRRLKSVIKNAEATR